MIVDLYSVFPFGAQARCPAPSDKGGAKLLASPKKYILEFVMFNQKLPNEVPFWIDDSLPYSPSSVSRFSLLPKLLSFSLKIGYIVILVIFILAAFKIPLFWFIAAFQAIFVFMNLFPWGRLTNQRITKVAKAQQEAQEKTGASLIGSAIHTAGHPLLKINQPVVIALKNLDISFYSYSSSIPIDTINVKDILSVGTVVYDDERVPHVGVIDNAAQAIQLTFQTQGKTYTCSFRRMYKVRPIEWYQAIEVARHQSS